MALPGSHRNATKKFYSMDSPTAIWKLACHKKADFFDEHLETLSRKRKLLWSRKDDLVSGNRFGSTQAHILTAWQFKKFCAGKQFQRSLAVNLEFLFKFSSPLS
jgi:hypothetical protein